MSQFSNYSKKSFFTAENQKSYGAEFQKLISSIKIQANQDTYIKTYLKKYLEFAKTVANKESPRFKQIP